MQITMFNEKSGSTIGWISATAIALSTAALLLASTGQLLASSKGSQSGLPIPRFVSLKSKSVNLRVGPGRDYKVEWLYVKSGLPLEVTQEFEHWRRVRDSEGTEGWVFHSLLSGKRTAIVAPWQNREEKSMVEARSEPSETASIVAKMEPGVVVRVEECNDGWCEIAVSNAVGYVEQPQLWGVYPDEDIKN